MTQILTSELPAEWALDLPPKSKPAVEEEEADRPGPSDDVPPAKPVTAATRDNQEGASDSPRQPVTTATEDVTPTGDVNENQKFPVTAVDGDALSTESGQASPLRYRGHTR